MAKDHQDGIIAAAICKKDYASFATTEFVRGKGVFFYFLFINNELIIKRAALTRAIRDFFWQQGFLELETPILVRLPDQEPGIAPMKLIFHNERGEEHTGYLHTSPEYALKKYLAAGFDKIFYLGKTFRDYESFGGNHNPEFTMIEWYRTNANYTALMDDCEGLYQALLGTKAPVTRINMRDLWRDYVGVNLDEYLTRETMRALVIQKGYSPDESERYEELFYRIFLNEIEPKLADLGAVCVHHYPAPMAALSKLSETDLGYAERVEFYINGLEIANGFSELTDPNEQLTRLTAQQTYRKKMGLDVFDIDLEFIEAVGEMPECTGIALGVDRLLMVVLGCKKIEEVVGFPANRLFNS